MRKRWSSGLIAVVVLPTAIALSSLGLAVTSATAATPKPTPKTVLVCRNVVRVNADLVTFVYTGSGGRALLNATYYLKVRSDQYGSPLAGEYNALLTGMVDAPPWGQANRALEAYGHSCAVRHYRIVINPV